MSNNFPVLLAQGQQLPAVLAPVMAAQTQSELSAGVGANFAVVSIKGKVFRIKHGGTDIPLMVNYNGQNIPAPSLDVIIPKANEALSKTWYNANYVEGSDAPPDCWSEDGINPLAPLQQRPRMVNAAGVDQGPCTDCRLCPMNVFGSKVNTATGKGGKACADTRKIAVLPGSDLDNDRFGGPMLFRTPAASLGNLAEYDRKLRAMGIPYYAVVTRISFDPAEAYPKLTFEPVRVITDAEAVKVLALRNDLRTDTVLSSGQAAPALPPPAAAAPALGPVPAALAPQPAPAPVQAVQQPQYAPPPVQVQAQPIPQPQPVAAPVQYAAPTDPFAAAAASIPPAAPAVAASPSPQQPAQQAFDPATFQAPPPVHVQQVAAAMPSTAPPVAQPAPTGAAVDPGFFSNLDALLAS